MIKVEIIADSINPAGNRIVSAIWKYPRFIHSEVLTHRVLSRNSASSRAIPVEKMIAAVHEEPAMFEYWGSAKRGMQAGDELNSADQEEAREIWKQAGASAVSFAESLLKLGLAKQNVNRALEPWAHMTVLVTATEWTNFFRLRAHPDAQPEFQVLAYRMLDAYLRSVPKACRWGEWHIPFGQSSCPNTHPGVNLEGLPIETQLKVATARAARISYLTFDGEFSVEKDVVLHDRLLTSAHLSPFEHCAQAAPTTSEVPPHWPVDQGNFKGFTPYRKQFPEESGTGDIDLHAILARKPAWVSL